MKKTILPLLMGAFAVLLFQACNKEVKEPQPSDNIDAATIARIKAKGFGTQDIQRVEGGYLVEGDIVLTEADVQADDQSTSLVIAKTEQYRTNNIVRTPSGLRTITVGISGTVSQNFSLALDEAIRRYNAQKLTIQFQKTTSAPNILIKIVNTRQYIASAGFPNNAGDPYTEIKYAKAYTSGFTVDYMATVLSHELGHCIGFRHTDYMDRSYSCGGGYANEGASTVGAIHITGTPTGPDAGSWMLACIGNNVNREFNENDKKALAYVY